MLRPERESSWVESVLKGRGRRSKVELEGFGVDWKGVEGVRGGKGVVRVRREQPFLSSTACTGLT